MFAFNENNAIRIASDSLLQLISHSRFKSREKTNSKWKLKTVHNKKREITKVNNFFIFAKKTSKIEEKQGKRYSSFMQFNLFFLIS